MTTTDLSKFGRYERAELVKLINAWNTQGLPKDFYNDEVTPMMNTHSGNVFLTNSDYQVAMMNGHDLESFYSLPYSGHEGFADKLKADYENGNIDNEEDIEYLVYLGIIDEKEIEEEEEEEE